MYYAIIGVFLLIQLSGVSLPLELELFRQNVRYYAYRGYHYVKTQVKKWFAKPEPQVAPEETPVQKYEDKYKERFQNMEAVELSEEELAKLKFNVLIETTPVGNVIMFYNSEKGAFEYYSDKIIPYRFLDTVGRKYVVQFRCKSVFVEKVVPVVTKGVKRYVKEANKYVSLGKIANFSFLQKIKKEATNKKLNMSFKDYKNMIL